MGTRVPLAGLPQPSTLFRRSHQGPGSPSLASLARVFPSRGTSPQEDITEAASVSAKDLALQAWRASRVFSPREGPLLERAPRVSSWILPRTKRSFARPPGLARVLSAPGYLCPAAERTWDDVRDAVAILVYKAVNKAAPSKGGSRPRHFRDKENTCTADITVGGPTGLCSANHRPAWTVAFLALVTLPPAVDRVHGLALYRAPTFPCVTMW